MNHHSKNSDLTTYKKSGLDNMRKNQMSLMKEFNISSNQFEVILEMYKHITLTEEHNSPDVLMKDITKGYVLDNVVIVSKIISDIIDFFREEMN